MSKYVPLELELIEEGQLLPTINDCLKQIQTQLVRHARQYREKAKGDKAKVSVEICLSVDDPETEVYGIVCRIKKTVPSPPARGTLAIGGRTQDERDCLFVRDSGSSYDDPRQGILPMTEAAGQDGKNKKD